MGGFAWVTLATNDSYSLGALVLAHSLKRVGTAHQIAVLVTPGVTSAMREKLTSVFNVVQEVNILDSRDEANLRLLKRPELGITFTKLHCWRLTQFEKCVFLDADTLVLQNSDELFEREELSAAPDVGWPDCFNSGVFVYRPSLETYEKLIKFALERGSFDGGDQGLLNLFFSDWARQDISRHLPFIYNVCSTACYSYLPAFKQFGENAKIIHFIGAVKPWLQYFNTETKKVQPSGDASHLTGFLQLWWDIFCSNIHPVLSPTMAGLAGAFSQLTLGVARTFEQDAFENVLRKQAWEVGNIDYLGKDSFDNIWSKISETLSASSPESQTATPAVASSEESPAAPAPEAAPKSQSDVTATPLAAPEPKAEEPLVSCPLPPKETPDASSQESGPPSVEKAAETTPPAESSPTVAPTAVTQAPVEPGSTPALDVKPLEQVAAAPTTPVPEAPVSAPATPVARSVPPSATESLPATEGPKSTAEAVQPAEATTPSTPAGEIAKPIEVAKPTEPSSTVKTGELSTDAPATTPVEVRKPVTDSALPAEESKPASAATPVDSSKAVETAAPSTTAEVKPAAAASTVAPSTPTPEVSKAPDTTQGEFDRAGPPKPEVVTASPTATAGTPSATPGSPPETSGTPPATPGTPTATPVTPSATPATPPATPGTPSAAPGTPSATPGTPPVTPGTPPVAPGTPTATPGAPPVVQQRQVPATPAQGTEASAPAAPKKTEKPKKSAPKPKK